MGLKVGSGRGGGRGISGKAYKRHFTERKRKRSVDEGDIALLERQNSKVARIRRSHLV